MNNNKNSKVHHQTGLHSYQPAASVRVHIAEDLKRLGGVIVDKDGVDATLFNAIPHDLNTVHGEWVQPAN